MKFRPTALAEVVVLTPETWFNQLGYFRESFRQEELSIIIGIILLLDSPELLDWGVARIALPMFTSAREVGIGEHWPNF